MRAYDVENRVFARRRTRLEMAEARAIADRLCDYFGVPPVLVMRTRDHARGSWYYPGNGKRPPHIALRWDAADWLVCHEVAHHVVTVHGSDRGHGVAWAAAYVDAVDLIVGAWYGRRLYNGFVNVDLAGPGPNRKAAKR